MRKLIYIVMVIGLLFSITACNFKEKLPDMYIQEAQLAKQEEKIMELLVIDNEHKIYDFKINDKVRAIQMNTYELKDGKWDMIAGGSWVFEDIKGRMALSFENIAEGYRVAIQSGGKKNSNAYHSEASKEQKNLGRATSYLSDREEILYEKEIPLAIQILTSKNAISSYNVEYFYQPEEYEKHGYEHVYAITIMFSEKTMNELDAMTKSKI